MKQARLETELRHKQAVAQLQKSQMASKLRETPPMKQVKCLILAMLMALIGLPQIDPPHAKAKEDNPYWAVVAWVSFSTCARRYGLINEDRANKTVLNLAKKNYGMEAYQVLNIIEGQGFKQSMDSFIKEVGGCRKIADDFKREHAL